jgi:DNA replication and repair protein RecF
MISEITIVGLRNLSQTDLSFCEGFNVFYGENGSGKTTILEAVHILFRGKSFRANTLDSVVKRGESLLRITGGVVPDGRLVRVGFERVDGVIKARVDGMPVNSLSSLATFLPLQLIDGDTQRFFSAGPSVRRSLLNWACFHLEEGYSTAWRRYHRALKQRNQALKSADRRFAYAWDHELDLAGTAVDETRARVVEKLVTATQTYIDQWLQAHEVTITYKRGWAAGERLLDRLQKNQMRDLEVGTTTSGPHRADLQVRALGVDAQHGLSRGQQKLLSVALMLGQLDLLSRQATHPAVALIDDLAAELDRTRVAQVMAALQRLPVQCLLTVIDPNGLPTDGLSKQLRRFHLQSGDVVEVV